MDQALSVVRPLVRKRFVPFLTLLLALTLLLVLAMNAGGMLVVDAPQPSDLILVLAGETDHRPAHALELLHQGFGRRVLIDVPADLHRRIKTSCATEGTKMADMLREILETRFPAKS